MNKRIHFKRVKNFLLNKNNKYSPSELMVNWFINLSAFLMILFGIMFAICAESIEVKKISDVALVNIPQPANAFSIVAFVAFIVFIASLVCKLVLVRKRKKALKKGENDDKQLTRTKH